MDVEALAAAAIYLFSTYNFFLNVYKKKVIKRKWRRRRWWMLTIHRNRTKQTMDNQLAEMLAEPSGYRLAGSNTCKIRLALTLRYLATGDSFRSLHYLFKVSSQLISRIVPEVCLALNEALKDFVKRCLKLLAKFVIVGEIVGRLGCSGILMTGNSSSGVALGLGRNKEEKQWIEDENKGVEVQVRPLTGRLVEIIIWDGDWTT
ncbi:hypothetical protein EVAR_9388_1 [Eumeta japonica]|uniref:DDE Tnp4 domain-containing protein n=1 Tax=Eumeta variegata TaxID=151549 RepID=A0A4C1UDT6_EUMVA|nr:hypothetical protein EVAR_9388_1 [Eumeta japonica]